MRSELCDIMRKHGSDKALGGRPGKKCHDYTLFYHELFSPIRDDVRFVMELGILRGASLRGWEEYFRFAWVAGLDIDPGRMIDEPSIWTYCGDQTDPAFLKKVMFEEFDYDLDLVIDDGLHTPTGNITPFRELWPRTTRFYIVEDVKEKYLDETLKGMKAAHPDAQIEVVDRTYPGSKKDNRLIVAKR